MFARVYGSAIRPINLGRELLGLIDSFDDQEPLDPHFLIKLNSEDLAAFANIEKHLLRELAEAATQYAEQKGLRHKSPISVNLLANNELKQGKFEITTRPDAQHDQLTDTAAGGFKPDAQSDVKTAVALKPEAVSSSPQLINAALILQNGDRIVLDGDALKIGRQATCRVAFNDSNVSREHAQMRRTSDGWKILDLGSTNGTQINGHKITEEKLLVNGDELKFGTSSARFEIS